MGWSEMLEPEARRVGYEASRSGWTGEHSHAREGRRSGNWGATMDGARLERPAINNSIEVGAVRLNGESIHPLPHENTDIYRPHNIKAAPPIFKRSSSEFLGFERRSRRFGQRYDLTKASFEEAKIRLGDPSVPVGDLHLTGVSVHRVRGAQLA